ncbi:flagellar hook-associated protein FlgK [Aestuariibacter sp. A3R04]|uniref:flagellar hook-associated protein FlgK n=1 Tax=Aestuariibacter sp. A3R04 TaxID=2841571 RepID=UPI001C092203|nr:flagellar hook-associated protein FlgK [Aestuariibacter sp. A3R04]MBU3022160.1 flagellar hook-associated protein FlgK [Aestuariibacter sp. A3R04]
MIRSDLFTIANSGVTASSKLLNTTSNNIANVNTEGYVRERTVFESNTMGGVGEASTERVISIFAQNQLRRDITSVGELDTFVEKTNTLDNLLASEANSIASGLSEFFASVQTASDDPSNLASREAVLGKASGLLSRLNTLSDFMEAKEEELNLQFTSEVNRANTIIESIGELNTAVLTARGNGQGEPSALLNERDKAINELAELMSIEVRENQYGSVVVNLSSGESLVLENGDFNLFELGSDADLTFKELQLATDFSLPKQNTLINVNESGLGGSIGGLFRFRDEILGPTQRDIGQMALAMADAVNTQNRLGMDLDMQLGGDIFNMPTFRGLNFEGTPDNLPVRAQVTPGEGAQLTDADYKITVDAVDGSGFPTSVTLSLLNSDGTPKLDASNSPVEYPGLAVLPGYNELPAGIQVEFEGTAVYSAGNEFLIQPSKYAASDLTLATERPEDLAFAAPLRVEADSNNLGDASVGSVTMSNTNVDAGLGPDASAFDGAGGIHDAASAPGGLVGAPAQILFTSATSFEVRDGAGGLITTVSNVTDYENLLADAAANGTLPPWPAAFSALNDYPGYDISLNGVPAAGDTFTLNYNTDGVADNTNALEIAQLQREALVQLSSDSNNNQRTFHDAYSSLVGRVGEKAAIGQISLDAAEAMKVQSENWFDSTSGVSLDEEAANLVRYQQSYAAAARILTTAQELFDTILAAAR